MRLDRSVIDSTKVNLRNYLKNYTGQRVPIVSSFNEGIDPLRTKGYLQKAFPHLFPRGEILLENSEREISISEVNLI